jgi:hypothetical protein
LMPPTGWGGSTVKARPALVMAMTFALRLLTT